jgi:hypothetical protein
VDIHGSYLSNTSTWMWSVLSMDIQLDIHPLPSLVNGCITISFLELRRDRVLMISWNLCFDLAAGYRTKDRQSLKKTPRSVHDDLDVGNPPAYQTVFPHFGM